MAVKGLDIFKLSPKKNCKECGSPTCMAFCMKVAQGAVRNHKVPLHVRGSDRSSVRGHRASHEDRRSARRNISSAARPSCMRHEKTLVYRNLFAADPLLLCMDDAKIEARKLAASRRLTMSASASARWWSASSSTTQATAQSLSSLVQEGSGHRRPYGHHRLRRTSTPQRQLSRRSRTTSPSSTAPTKDNYRGYERDRNGGRRRSGRPWRRPVPSCTTPSPLWRRHGNKNLILDVTAETVEGNSGQRSSRAPHRSSRTATVPSAIPRIVNLGESVRPGRSASCKPHWRLCLHSEIRLHHRHGADRLRRGPAAVRPASEHLHRPAEADEGRARHLPDERRNARRSLRADGRLRADLLPGLR